MAWTGAELGLLSRPHTPPEQVTEALRRANGELSLAAAMLGIDPSALRQRVRDNANLWPAGVPQPQRRTPARKPPVAREPPLSEADIEATRRALREAHGSMADAARVLGLTRQGVHYRVTAFDAWPSGVPRRRRYKRTHGHRFYLAQFGSAWSVTLDALRRILREGAEKGGYTIDGDGVQPLVDGFSEVNFRARGGVLPKRWRHPGVVLIRPLRWTTEDFRAALLALDEGRYEDLA